MPAIRDYIQASESVTTDAGLTLPMPQYSENDLLIMFVVADTFNGGVWSPPSGWSTLYERIATGVGAIFCYKIASASEPVSYTMGASVNETYSGFIFSVEDVDTTNPFGSPPVYNEALASTVSTFTYPQITTEVDNCLVLYLSGYSNQFGSFVGQVVQLLTSSRTASSVEGQTAGFYVQATAGLTPADIVFRMMQSANTSHSRAVIQICPPSGGAVVVPAYRVADESVCLTQCDVVGTNTNFPMDAGISSSGITDYSATLNGQTVLGNTQALLLDTGIQPAQTAVRTITPSTAAAGVPCFVGFRRSSSPAIDFSSKALSLQIGTSDTAGHLASLDSGLSGLGVWMGARSGTGTDYKIWQVHGAAVSYARSSFTSVLVELDEEGTVATAGTLDTSAVVGVGVWLFSRGGIAGIKMAGLWAIGLVTVAGGTSTRPVAIGSLMTAIGAQAERATGLLQGAAQGFVSQPVLIGAANTHTNLDLSFSSLEFPGKFSVLQRELRVQVGDDFLGLKYRPNASDIIKHTNALVSSSKRFHWGLHADASTSATYDFTRLSVIGAGTITLNKAITIDRLVINDYSTIDISDATLTNCTIAGAPAANDSLTTNASTSLTGCTIDVSGVTAGNRWVSVADPSIFEDCSFTGGGGHAIRITTAGTYSFDANMFSGFGADGTDGAAIFNDSGGAVTINITGGGSTPTVKNGTGASTTVQNAVSIVLTNVVVGSRYYVYNIANPELVYGSGVAASETVTLSTAYVSDTTVGVRVRHSTSDGSDLTKRYKPFSTNAQLTAAGASVYIVQEEDPIAVPT
jgi:hypothetical protein